MFERGGRSDGMARTGVACELVLEGGGTTTGFVILPAGKAMADALNAAGAFIELELPGRERHYLARSAIRSIRPLDLPAAEPLGRRLRHGEAFDPYVVLGVAPDASRDAVRQAYHALAKAYHPDRLHGLGLPAEILDYATAMAKRVNAAYSMLTSSLATA